MSPLCASDLRFDLARHISTDPHGRVVPNVTSILAETGVSTDFEDLACVSPRLAERIAFRCALGSAVHADCHSLDDDDLIWESVHHDAVPYVEAWATCRRNLGLTPLTRERRVYHPVHDFTGILDGIFLVERSERCPGRVLVDLKIGDPNDAAAHLQTAAYCEAYLAEHPGEQISERWAIRLCPELDVPYRIVNYTSPQRPEAWRDFQKFLACLAVFHEQPARRRAIR